MLRLATFITAPTHPQATLAAVYPALSSSFKVISINDFIDLGKAKRWTKRLKKNFVFSLFIIPESFYHRWKLTKNDAFKLKARALSVITELIRTRRPQSSQLRNGKGYIVKTHRIIKFKTSRHERKRNVFIQSLLWVFIFSFSFFLSFLSFARSTVSNIVCQTPSWGGLWKQTGWESLLGGL